MIMEESLPGKNEEQQEQKEQNPVVVSPSDDKQDENCINNGEQGLDDKQDGKFINNDKQIVVYDPPKFPPFDNVVVSQEIVPVSVSEPVSRPTPIVQNRPRTLPAVGSFTVQCAVCFKWRIIPSKERYEEIRERILERPFTCELAKEWKPELVCGDPNDIEQDGSRVWAIDKPNIAKTPPGWDRELRIRAEGGSKFADVYYTSPTGKRLRSMVEVHRYLLEHPEYIRQGVSLSQFSFQIPRPLQENYVRKRTNRLTGPSGEPVRVNPLSWAPPDDGATLRLGGPGLSSPYSPGAPTDVVTEPATKKSRSSRENMSNSDPMDMQQHRFKMKGPHPPTTGVSDL